MDEYKTIPIHRRVSLLSRIEELRDDLSIDECEQLLALLAAMTYADWIAWFIQNCESATAYAASTKAERKKHRRVQSSSALLIHHAAMFMTGLHEIAQSHAFPEINTIKSERFYFEMSAISAAIRAWDDFELQIECSLFWLFDELTCPSNWPFKQD